MALTGCCGCNNLRNGSVAVGITLLVLSCLAVLSSTGQLIKSANATEERIPHEPAYIGVGLAIELVTIIFNVLLILGVQNSSRGMILSWVIYHGIYFSVLSLGVIGLLVGLIIVAQAASAGWIIALLAIVTIGVAIFNAACWYWFSVVVAHLNELSDENGFGYQKHSTALVDRQ